MPSSKTSITPAAIPAGSDGRGWRRWVAVGDLHAPEQDEAMVAKAVAVIREYQPHVVVLIGDLIEGQAASRWAANKKHSLKEEFEAAAGVVERLKEAAKGARWALVEGNHDANLMGAGRIDPRLHEVIDYRRHLAKALKGWWVVPYVNARKEGVYRLGAVSFAHGFDCTAHGERNEAVRLAHPGGLLVRGHTHRPVAVTQAKVNEKVALPYWYANTGTLSSLKPPYTGRMNTDRWGGGVVVGVAKMGRAVQTTQGGRMGRGWTWEAETVVFQTSDPEVVDLRTGGFRERHPATERVLPYAASLGSQTPGR